MTKLERMLAAFSGKETDRVPVYPIIAGASRVLTGVSYYDYGNDPRACADSLIAAADELELDCIVTLIDLSVEAEGWGCRVVFPENEAARPDYDNRVIASPSDYAKIERIDFRKSRRMCMQLETCKIIADRRGGSLPVISFVFGPMGILSMLRGQQDLYTDLYDCPEEVKRATAVIGETIDDYCSAIMDTGVNGVMLDTLFASGSIMRKEMWKEFEGDSVAKIAGGIRRKGGMVMVHNCGNRIYFDAQIEAMRPDAISFLHPPDDCADFTECKRLYGDKTTLIGCVTPSSAVTATDEEWESECRRNFELMGKGGRYVLATGCEFPANAPLSRAAKMVEVAKSCRY